MTQNVCLLILGLVLASPCWAQVDPLRPPRTNEPVTLDGRLLESVWSDSTPLPLTMNFPSFQGDMTERTEIFFAYDSEFLYAAGRFWDALEGVPNGMSLARDRPAESDELFAVILDTFSDKENALIFMTTPSGIRVDQSVYGDAQMLNNEFPINESWNTFWDVATTVHDSMWTAELRIPWSSLRFQDQDGTVRMGLHTWRWNARLAEGHTFPAVDPKWGFTGPMKPSIAHPIEFEGIHSRRPLYITPYLLGGLAREAELTDDGSSYSAENDPTIDAGIDIKLGLTSNLTLDGTFNTDFAQVEADDQQANLTRFSLFFPEKRQFFQERSSVFEFNTGGQTRLFYSRRIGLSDEGPVRLLGGTRVVGRVGDWDVGAMSMQTAKASFDTDDGPFDVPAENFGVVRIRKRILNPFSYGGGILTTRLGTDGTYNVAMGLDATLRKGEKDVLLVGWAQTFDDTVSTVAGDPASSLARVRLERRNSSGWAWDLDVTRAGANYLPDMGFIFRTDFVRFGDRIAYGWQPSDSSPFFSLEAGVIGEAYLRNEDGSLESARIGPSLFGSLRSGRFFSISPTMYIEHLREPFELDDDVEVPIGDYRFFSIQGAVEPGPTRFRWSASGEAGSFYDGWRASVGFGPVWSLSSHLELRADYQINRVGFPDRNDTFSADIARLRVQAALDTRWSMSAFLQYNMSEEEVILNARLRFNAREGNDLYLVYNEGANVHRSAVSPRLPWSDSRTILLKYTYTFLR